MKTTFRRIALAALCAAAAFTLYSCTGGFETYDLRCEALSEPEGIDSPTPHFSWKINSKLPMEQSAYRITVRSVTDGKTLWDSGKVESAEQIMVPWGGEPLTSRQQCEWRLKIWDGNGKASAWSAPQRFGVGILKGDSLEGEYIGAVPGEGRASLLRKSFKVRGSYKKAVLYVNSLGYHEVWLNGQRISDAVLGPAVSQLNRRSLIVATDVTPLLKRGENEIVIAAGSGWYKKGTFDAVYEGPLVKAELDLMGSRGPVCILSTDSSWSGAWGGRKDPGTWTSHHFDGEIIDARAEPLSFETEDLDKLEWVPVDVVENVGDIIASMQMCEPCTVQEVITPVSIEKVGENSWVADFGKVVNAMLDVTLPALPEGQEVSVSASDFRDAEGKLDPRSADKWISSGRSGGDRFRNVFNHHVFRYILFDNLSAEPVKENIRALRMRTDFPSETTFTSSDPELNAIHDMIARTMENLAFDGYMVDCANIERLGYGGDGNASTLSLQILADVAPLYYNWLTAWTDSIKEDGSLPHTAPNPYRAGGGPYWCTFIVQAPWRTWMSYSDPRTMELCYPSMKHWLDYVDAYTVDGLLEKWPDSYYRWWFLGDWAAPDGVDVKDPESIELVNNCSMLQAYLDLEKIATLTGHPEEAPAFRQRYETLKATIHEKLYHPETCTYASGSQIDMVFPLLTGVVPESLREDVRQALFDRTEELWNGHLATGLVGVPVVTEWATLEKECDWMYGMLKKHGYPGYLYMLDNGATGTWEHWNGRRSRLHNCFNGVESWFYQALGGITPDEPGYRHIVVDPQIPKGLESVSVRQATPYGTVCVSRDGKNLHVEIPVGVSATIAGKEYSCGSHDLVLE